MSEIVSKEDKALLERIKQFVKEAKFERRTDGHYRNPEKNYIGFIGVRLLLGSARRNGWEYPLMMDVASIGKDFINIQYAIDRDEDPIRYAITQARVYGKSLNGEGNIERDFSDSDMGGRGSISNDLIDEIFKIINPLCDKAENSPDIGRQKMSISEVFESKGGIYARGKQAIQAKQASDEKPAPVVSV